MHRSLLVSRLVLLIVMGVSACAPLPEPTATEAIPTSTTEAPSPTAATVTAEDTETATAAPEPTLTEPIPVTGPLMIPGELVPPPEKLIYDVKSSGTFAPYGDSYRINRLERPFEQDMTYVPELDILSVELSQDADWYYVSLQLNGSDPNDALGIRYGVEIDRDADGFGDFIVWAAPPYGTDWDSNAVLVFEDSDQDTGGRSSSQSDAGFEGNGYDTRVDDDPDLAWVRMQEGAQARVQLAFKKSWAGASFVLGAVADGGIKDVSQFDYNDRFEASQAGSPLKNDPNYPLGPLFAVDNTCWMAYNLEPTLLQPKFCPPDVLPTATRRPPSNSGGLTTVPPPVTTQAPSTEPPTQPPTDPPTQPPTEPQPTEPTACVPDFDPLDCGDIGYNPDTCQCNIEEPTLEPIEP